MQIDLISRSYGFYSLDNTIGEACAICAEALSTSLDECAQGDAYMQVLETVYFTVIFLLRSIQQLADFARDAANRHIYMVLKALACWMDAIVTRCVEYSVINYGKLNMNLLRNNFAFRSLALVCVLVRHCHDFLCYN